jgi:hypothetical protein
MKHPSKAEGPSMYVVYATTMISATGPPLKSVGI